MVHFYSKDAKIVQSLSSLNLTFKDLLEGSNNYVFKSNLIPGFALIEREFDKILSLSNVSNYSADNIYSIKSIFPFYQKQNDDVVREVIKLIKSGRNACAHLYYTFENETIFKISKIITIFNGSKIQQGKNSFSFYNKNEEISLLGMLAILKTFLNKSHFKFLLDNLTDTKNNSDFIDNHLLAAFNSTPEYYFLSGKRYNFKKVLIDNSTYPNLFELVSRYQWDLVKVYINYLIPSYFIMFFIIEEYFYIPNDNQRFSLFSKIPFSDNSKLTTDLIQVRNSLAHGKWLGDFHAENVITFKGLIKPFHKIILDYGELSYMDKFDQKKQSILKENWFEFINELLLYKYLKPLHKILANKKRMNIFSYGGILNDFHKLIQKGELFITKNDEDYIKSNVVSNLILKSKINEINDLLIESFGENNYPVSRLYFFIGKHGFNVVLDKSSLDFSDSELIYQSAFCHIYKEKNFSFVHS